MRPRFRPVPAFTPYFVVSIVHLVAISVGPQALVEATKPLLMPALLVGLVLALPHRRSAILVWGGLALALSWLGDVSLSSPAEAGFLVGVGFFALAHLAYIGLYVRSLRMRRPPWATLALVAWWVALVTLLAPHMGPLLVPVAVYGLILGTAAALSFGTTRLIAMGALVFLVSDTLLGLDRFLPGFSFAGVDLLIMLTYCAGQGLIIAGAVAVARRRAGYVNAGQLVPATVV